MISPLDVPSASFQGLRCEVNYCSRSHNKTETPRQPAVEPLNSSQYAPEAPLQHTYSLRSNPRRSKKAAVAQEEIDDAFISPLSSWDFKSERSPGDPVPEDMELLMPGAMVAEMACLLDFAFRKLIGVKKASQGLKTVKITQSPLLIDIAPAVWNLQYLQASISRRSLVGSRSILANSDRR